MMNNEDYYIQKYSVWGYGIVNNGEYYRLLTGAFLHGGIYHYIVNMYSLYILGSQIEGFLGRGKYLAVYLFSALIGSLFSIIFNTVPSVGASGAIFGILGSLLYFGYHYRVYLGSVIKSQILPLIILNLAIGFLSNGQIDNFAHIGGLIGGILMTMAVGVKYKSSKAEMINGAIVSIILVAFLIFVAFNYINYS
jgi:rhomboid protease GluP